jgi:hypothetical protein
MSEVNNAQFGSPPNDIMGIVGELDIIAWLSQGLMPVVWGINWIDLTNTVFNSSESFIKWDDKLTKYQVPTMDNWNVRKFNMIVGGIVVSQRRSKELKCVSPPYIGKGFTTNCFHYHTNVFDDSDDSNFAASVDEIAASAKLNLTTRQVTGPLYLVNALQRHMALSPNLTDSQLLAHFESLKGRMQVPFRAHGGEFIAMLDVTSKNSLVC